MRHRWPAQLARRASHISAVAGGIVRLKTHQTGRGGLRDLDQLTQGRILRLDVLQKFTGVGLPVAIRLVLVADGLGATQAGDVLIKAFMGAAMENNQSGF